MKVKERKRLSKDAREWLKEAHEIPERMPNVDLLYLAGATYVSVEEYEETSGRMVLNITFPFPNVVAESTKLWLHIVTCDHDGVRLNKKYPVGTYPVNVEMLILGPEEYIDRRAQGPNTIEVPIEW